MKRLVGQDDPQAPEPVELTDGTITLRPADAAAHLAGEDDELAKRLNGGVSTPATVRTHIDRAAAMWAADGPTFNFSISVSAPLQPISSSEQSTYSYHLTTWSTPEPRKLGPRRAVERPTRDARQAPPAHP
jgi:hypothetical protein